MRKKLIATLVAGAVMSTGLIGLTACGGGHDINKGEEVSKEDWAKAITATVEAKNYTEDMYSEITVNMSGEYSGVKIAFTASTKGEGKNYIDADNNTSYSTANVKVEVTGDVPESMKEQYNNKEYKTESYIAKVDDDLYEAIYDSSETEAEWDVDFAYEISGDTYYLLNGDFATEKDGTTSTLDELYDAFTYSGGVYTATLWRSSTEMKISVSVKGGYVVGVAAEYTVEQDMYGMTMKVTGNQVCNLSNYGSTTVSASEEAKNAINNYVNGN